MPKVIRRPRAGRPRPDRRCRAARLRREGIPRRDDAGRRPPERAVGRRDLHLLPEQGRPVPRRLRSDQRRGHGRARGPPRRGRSSVDKLAIAIGFFLDAVDGPEGGAGHGVRAGRASGAARSRSRRSARAHPPPRAAHGRRRSCSCARASPRGELPAWIDAEGLAAGYLLLLDGLLLWRIEQGDAYRREEAERRAFAGPLPHRRRGRKRRAPRGSRRRRSAPGPCWTRRRRRPSPGSR